MRPPRRPRIGWSWRMTIPATAPRSAAASPTSTTDASVSCCSTTMSWSIPGSSMPRSRRSRNRAWRWPAVRCALPMAACGTPAGTSAAGAARSTKRATKPRRRARATWDSYPLRRSPCPGPAWQDIGGFDPWFFLYNEDVDLCLRLRRRSWRLRFEPALSARHALGGATGSAERSPLYLEHLSRGRLRPFRPLLYRGYLALVHSVWVTVRAAALVGRTGTGAGPRIRALVRGHLSALRDLVDRPPRMPGR